MGKRIFFFLFIFSAFSSAYAQTVIRGVCVNADGNNVEYVTIGIEGVAWRAYSDASGHFNLTIPDNLKNGSITFAHISYTPYTRSWTITF